MDSGTKLQCTAVRHAYCMFSKVNELRQQYGLGTKKPLGAPLEVPSYRVT